MLIVCVAIVMSRKKERLLSFAFERTFLFPLRLCMDKIHCLLGREEALQLAKQKRTSSDPVSSRNAQMLASIRPLVNVSQQAVMKELNLCCFQKNFHPFFPLTGFFDP
jgi:hypothetical protein